MSSEKQNDSIIQLNNVISNICNSDLTGLVKNPETDFIRRRKLPLDDFLKVTLNMQGGSIRKELYRAFPVKSERMSATAYEKAKDKVCTEMFRKILHLYNDTLTEPKLLNDKYRLFAIDGSDFNPIYSENSDFVMVQKGGKRSCYGKENEPYCQVHANLLFDLENQYYYDCITQPKAQSNERSAAIDMIKNIHSNNPFIVTMDRGYDGFNLMENCNRIDGCYYVIRTKTGRGGIREVASLPDAPCDKWFDVRITTSGQYYKIWHDTEPNLHLIQCPKKPHTSKYSKNTDYSRWDFEQFCKMRFRVVKFKINDEGSGKEVWETLLTNLPEDEFGIFEMKQLYNRRWGIETSFRNLKYSVGAIQFHSKKDDFILMELFAHLIMYNVISRAISYADIKSNEDNLHDYKIDFTMAVEIIHRYFRIDCNVPPNNITADIEEYLVPIRLGRKDIRKLNPKSAIYFVYRVAA